MSVYKSNVNLMHSLSVWPDDARIYSSIDRTRGVHRVINVVCVPRPGNNLLIRPNVLLALAILNDESSEKFCCVVNIKRLLNLSIRSINSLTDFNVIIFVKQVLWPENFHHLTFCLVSC